MSEAGPEGVPPERNEAAILDEQERALRRELGAEHEFLVDQIIDGMEVKRFVATQAGQAVLRSLRENMQAALAVLRDPTQKDEATLKAAYELRVAFSALDTIAGIIAQGTNAERAVDEQA